jgi:hypothetical protein
VVLGKQRRCLSDPLVVLGVLRPPVDQLLQIGLDVHEFYFLILNEVWIVERLDPAG